MGIFRQIDDETKLIVSFGIRNRMEKGVLAIWKCTAGPPKEVKPKYQL